jgi:outer membrane protein assembly factor BamB
MRCLRRRAILAVTCLLALIWGSKPAAVSNPLVALFFLILGGPLVTGTAVGAVDVRHEAAQILDATGVRGGLVVHLGCGDGSLTAALRADDRYLVQGLATDPADVARARQRLWESAQDGRISIDQFDGRHLPYIDNVVNLLVAADLGDVSQHEALRVLAPGGVACVQRDGRWQTLVKPWSEELDEWTHYLHDASNNAVSHDERIGPLRHLQWQAGPRWSRHHDHMASVSAMVSAAGRVFYILDHGSPVSPQLPADWKLVARDAFNGKLLWNRAIPQWQDSLWPLKSGPANLPRRLVAVDEVVYTTLGITAPVCALDAATGETVREYPESKGAEEILCQGERLLVVVNRTPVDFDADLADDPEQGRSRDGRTTYSPTMARIWAGVRSRRWTQADRALLAFDAASGRLLWQRAGRVIPCSLAADRDTAYYHDGERIVALDTATGQPRWTSDPVPVWQGLDGRGLQSWFAPTLVVHEDTVLFSGGEKMHMSYVGWGSEDIGQDTMTALSTETGKRLWTAPHPYSGYNSPEDLFVADGRVWTGVTAKGGPQGRYIGHDPASGDALADFPPTLDTFWFHHRCYRAKATDRYILCSRTGIEFIDLETGQWTIHHWVRGGCLYGIMPANGLIYAPPHPCACYPEAKLNGLVALAGTRGTVGEDVTASEQEQNDAEAVRFVRGPAYGQVDGHPSSSSPTSAWPTYRCDPLRSGATPVGIATALQPAWQSSLGGRLTQAVAVEGLVFVADTEKHAVHALDLETGRSVWQFVAGGRIDSPPTCDHGYLLFGSADGWVYCLRAADGALAWRYRAAPRDLRLVAADQVESVWPLPGSVLVQDGVATVVAGRSRFLDGGLRLCRLDVRTGRVLSEKMLDDVDEETDEQLQRRVNGLNMPVALPDILSSDAQQLFMRSCAMDLEGNALPSGRNRPAADHLFAPYGFTDDTWFHRTYWMFGDSFQGGVGGFANGKRKPAGRILVHDASTVFGYGRKPEYYRWGSAIDYQLFAAARPDSDSGTPRGVVFENSSSLDPTGRPLTIAAWVKPDKPNGTILVRGANTNGFALILRDRRPCMLLRTGGQTYQASGREPIGDDWTHVAGTLDADGRMLVYVDGRAAGGLDGVPLLSGNPQIAMKLGFDDTNQLLPEPLAPWDGALDEVMLFHRALAPDQVGQLAAADRSQAAAGNEDLVLHLDFTGGRLRDSSPHGNHGSPNDWQPEFLPGARGDALAIAQPKDLIPAASDSRGSRVAYRWTREIPIMVRAMALAGDVLWIAGPADLIDEDAAFENHRDPETQARLAAQEAALAGQSGATLLAIDAATGDTRAEYALEELPVFDGLSIANGRLLISTVQGRLCVFAAQENGR